MRIEAEGMNFVVAINNVNPSDRESIGIRAHDLSILKEKRLNIPLAFMIRGSAFELFMEENTLKPRVESLLKEHEPAEAYMRILELFKNSGISRELSEELSDAYESLTIDTGATASTIVSEWDYPFITLIRSPSYPLSTDDEEGIVQNIRGKDSLAEALKQIWASAYSPRSVAYRNKTGMVKPFSLGVIVQKMKKITRSAITYSRSDLDDKRIIVKSFLGYPDMGFGTEVLGKDYHEVDINSLGIAKAEINTQEFMIERDFETEELVKQELRIEGSGQKLNDRMVSEVARITKRSKSFIEKDLKLYLGIKDDFIYVLLANRMVAGPKKLLESEEEFSIVIDSKAGKTLTSRKQVLVAEQDQREAFSMPKILSSEEAKEELLKQGAINEPCQGEEPDEKSDEKPGQAVAVEVYEHKSEQEEQVEKEINLLEEVLQIKDIIERMEEHALNNSKEAYEREAKQLKFMMSRIREEE